MNANGTVASAFSQKIVSGSGGLVLADGDLFGESVAALGDLDGDGITDMAVGAKLDDTGGAASGAVYVLFMNAAGTVKGTQKIARGTANLTGLADGDHFGSAVATVGDLDGDGVTELAVGASGDETGGANRGATYIVFLNSDGSVKSSQKIASGTGGGPTLANNDSFGRSVASIGDLDGDGVSDLAVGAYFDGTGGTGRGAIHILMLNANGTVKSRQKIASGTGGGPLLADNDFFGSSVGQVGDLDGDGLTDLGVGARGDNTGASDAGALYLLFMKSDGTAHAVRKIASATGGGPTLAGGDQFGTSVVSLGDLNGDGVISLAVGATLDDTGIVDGGTVYTLSLNAAVMDFGDAPDAGAGGGVGDFQTLLADNGARHLTVAGLRIGTAVDTEADGLQSYHANGDDVNVVLSDDDNGLPNADADLLVTVGTQPTINVLVTNTVGRDATLYGWIDTNGDGFMDNVTERASIAVPNLSNNFLVTLTFPTIPIGFAGRTAARFRLSTDTNAANSFGPAQDGEVEDYVAFVQQISDGAADKNKTTKIAHLTNGGPTLVDQDNFGGATASIGDLDGDGVNDMAVGAMYDDTNGTDRGAVYVMFMNADGTVRDTDTVKIASGTGGGPTLANNAQFGSSIAAIGDLNVDGVVDLAVGARGNGSGSMHILFMNANGTVKSRTNFSAGSAGDYFGSAVTSIGDLDGDGVADIAVGAPGDDTNGVGNASRGAAYVLLMNTNGTVKSGGFKIDGLTTDGPILSDNSLFGSSLASLGDLDGDGIAELAVGARLDTNNRGAVYVMFVNPLTATNRLKNATVKIGSSTGGGPVLANRDYFGTSMAAIGDIDGDGKMDLAVGAEGDSSSGGSGSLRGAVYVLLLNATGTAKSRVKIAPGLAGGPTLVNGDFFGSAVAAMGDIDGDGAMDLAVGAERDDTGGLNRGAVYLLHLNPALDFGDAPDLGPGTDTGDYQTLVSDGGPSHRIVSGLRIGAITGGETDGNPNASATGDDELAALPDDEDGVSSPLPDLTVALGTSPTVNVFVTNTIGTTATLYGWIDFNRDGVFDNLTERASATVTSGTNNQNRVLTFPVANGAVGKTYARFRLSTDVAAANPTGSAANGEVEDYEVLITQATDLTVNDLKTVTIADDTNGGPFLNDVDRFGSAVAKLGDVDGDGVGDLAVGASGDDTGGTNRGAVHILFMNTDGTVRDFATIASGSVGAPTLADGDLFGASVASVGDFDSDGVADLVVGAPQDDTGGTNRGAIHLMLLNADGTVKSLQTFAHQILTAPTLNLVDGDQFGTSVASIGDLDLDGVTDIAVGAIGDDTGGSAAGAVYVLFLNSDGTLKGRQKIADSTGGGPTTLAPNDFFGSSITNVGDLNGNGVSDLVVGAPGDDTGGTDRGAVHVLFMLSFGFVSSFQKISDGIVVSLADGDAFGSSVTWAGDMNSDGVSDIAVGASGDDTGGTDRGAVHLVMLNATGTAQSDQSIADQTNGGPALADGDFFGSSITVLGDLDDDGVMDLAVGAMLDDTGGNSRGAVHTLFLRALGPEIHVSGDGETINDGDVTPDVFDDTDFGTAALVGGSVTHTFEIFNFGSQDVTLGGGPTVAVTGLNAADFVVTLVPATTIVPDDFTTFAITFTPSALGLHSATISIQSNDSNEDPFTFDVQGQGIGGFIIVETLGFTEVDETGLTDTFTVQLDTQPNADVVITLTSDDPGEATVDFTTLTFTPLNWNVPQIVTVTGVDDPTVDGFQFPTITLSIDDLNSDDDFDPADDQYVFVTSYDDDVAGYTVAPLSPFELVVDEAGTTTATFDVVLTAQPLTDVVISILNTDPTEVDVVATLTFTFANWDTVQTVTVTGVDDFLVDGDQITTLRLLVDDLISDPAFAGIGIYDVRVRTTDDDVAGFTVVESLLTTVVNESGTMDTFTVVLDAQPLTDVVITVDGTDATEATVGPATLTFTTLNWNVPQTVTVTGVDDFIDDGDQASEVFLAVDSFNSDDVFDLLSPQSVSVTTIDDDEVNFAVTVTGLDTTVSEAGSSDTFSVRLLAQPVSDVVLTVTSGDLGEVTVDVDTLTFTSADWNSPQTVTVTGVDDFLVDGNQLTNITLAVEVVLSDLAFSGVASQAVPVTTTDNDVVDVLVTEVGGTLVSESGTTDTFSVVLGAQPLTNVVITVTNGDATEMSLNATTLTFTNANWNVPQVVTVTGVDDPTLDGNQISTVTLAVNDAASDDVFDSVPNRTVSVTTTDNDAAGFLIVETSGTIVSESGTTDSFTVVLTTQPLTDVVFSVISGDTGEATVNVATLTFTSGNWNSPQTVTVTGVDDPTVDGSQVTTITVSVVDASSNDGFDSQADQTVSATTTDNDIAGFTVSQSGGTTSVNESGTTDSFTVVLNAQPLTNVVITVNSSDAGEATVSPATLTFTPANWNMAQTVTVTGVNDPLADGSQTSTITLSIDDANTDAAFDPVLDQTVSVTTVDNDVPGFTVTQTGGTTVVSETGSTDSVSVVLTAQPLSNVVILVNSPDTTEATVGTTTLTFTSANWSTPQSVTITGVNDFLVDGTQVTAILFAVDDPNSDDAFDSVANQTVNVSTTDNDVAGFVVTPSDGTTVVSESGTTDSITVVLTAQPTSNVVLLVSSSDTGEATVTSSVTFTTVNWNVAQTVTVAGVADSLVDGDQVSTLTFSIDDANSDNVFDGVADQTVSATTTEVDSAVFSIGNASALEGSGISFTVSLSKPADVTTSVTVTTANGTATVAGSDYSPITGQAVTFAAGETSQTVIVNTTHDTNVEDNETFTVALGGLVAGGRNVTISGSNQTATGTIIDNDSKVSVSVSPGSVQEDGSVPLVYTFTRLGVVSALITVNFTVGGTATFSSTPGQPDYQLTGATTFNGSTGTLDLAGGVTTASITVTPAADTTTESAETVIVSVASGSAYLLDTAFTATGTIHDDDALLSLSLSPAFVTESGSANLVYTFSRSGDTSQPLTAKFNVSGSATVSTDYSVSGASSLTGLNGTITFAAGASTAILGVDPVSDSDVESDETVGVALATGSGYLPPATTAVVGTIDNDDFGVSLALTPTVIAEDASGTLAYTFSRTGGLNQPLIVRVGVTGTALVTFDYSQTGATTFGSSGGTVTFASGASTVTMLVDPVADTNIEADETVELSVLPGTGYDLAGTTQQTGTITNDDQRVNLTSATSVVAEDGTENIVVTFTRTGATSAALSVPMTLTGSALLNTDYVASGDAIFSLSASSLEFGPGVTTATLTFDPTADSDLEPSEVLLLTLPQNVQRGVISPIVTSGTILNDDSIVYVAVIPDRVAEEGPNNLIYTFQRFGDLSRAAVVNFSVSGSATFETDYSQAGATTFTASAGSVEFPVGAATATVTLDPVNDGILEPNETALLTLLPGTGYVPTGAPALGTIVNQVPTVAVSVIGSTELPETSTSNLQYRFTRTGELGGTLTVQFSVGGTARFEADYLQSGASRFSATDGAITFGDGVSTVTVTLDPQIDSVREQTETVVLTLLPDAEVYRITGTGTGTTSILDAPQVSVSVAPTSVSEDGTANLVFTFTRTGVLTQSSSVDFQVGGSAQFATDYTTSGAAAFSATTGRVTFAAGSATKTVTINPTADFEVEADETVSITLVPGGPFVVGGDATVTATITNDDVPPPNLVSLDSSGRLRITDVANRNDRLTITKNSSNELVIKDSTNRFGTTVGQQATAQEVRVPLTSIPARTLIVELNGGADSINLAGLPAGLLAVTVYGGAGNDTIIGSAGNDTIIGGEGNDSIDGGSGNDGITGDAGNDTILGNKGNDTILGGTGDDSLLGGDGSDSIMGQEGRDKVQGQGGIDRIAGGSGFGRDTGDVVSDLTAEIDEAFRISFDSTRFLLI